MRKFSKRGINLIALKVTDLTKEMNKVMEQNLQDVSFSVVEDVT